MPVGEFPVNFFRLPRMAIALPIAVLSVAALIAINVASFRSSSDAVAKMEEARLTRDALNGLIQAILDAKTGQRGYLLTGEKRYLDPYNDSINKVNQQLDALRQIFTPYKDELGEFGIMSQHISRKLAELDLSIRMRRENKEEAWRLVLTTNAGGEQMHTIREQAAKLAASSMYNMQEGQVQIKKTLLLSRIGVSILVMVSLLAFYMYLVQTKALLNAGIRDQETLKHERDQLDLEVRERTADLGELATHLQNVREDERGHLARELHDELGALLTAAKLDVARLKSRLGPTEPEAIERLTHLTTTLNSGIALKRRIIEDLRPSSLSHLGLVASLEILAREFEAGADLSITTDLEHVDLGGSTQLTVYRLVQESLTNIGKYAQATQIVISLRSVDSYVKAEVHDNGNGFDSTAVGPGSHGLSGMRHRVEAAGGRLTVTTKPQAGTKITATLPKDR